MDFFKNNSNTSQAFWLAISQVSNLLLALVSAAILSRYLSKDDYGTYRQIIYIYGTLQIIFAAGLPGAYSYFLPKMSPEKGKDILNKLTKLFIVLGLTFSLFLFIAAPSIANVLSNDNLVKGLRLFSPMPFLLLPTLGLQGIYTTLRKTHLLLIYNTVSRIGMLFFIVAPVIFWGGNYENAIIGWIFSSLITLLVAIYLKYKPFKDIKIEDSQVTYKKIASYTLPLMLASLYGLALRSADQFFISHYFGQEVFADFSNGFIELPFVSMVTGAVGAVLLPVFAKKFGTEDFKSDFQRTWNSVLTKSALIIYPLLFFCFFFSKEIILFLYSPKYVGSINYFKIILFLNLFNIIIFSPFVLATGNSKVYANTHLIIAICVWTFDFASVNFFKSPLYIAYISVLFNSIKILILFFWISKKMSISIFKLIPFKSILFISIISISVCIAVRGGVNSLIHIDSNLMKLIISFGIYSLLFVLVSRIFKIDYYQIIKPLISK